MRLKTLAFLGFFSLPCVGFGQALTDYNTYEGKLTTEMILNVFSHDWDTVGVALTGTAAYIDSNCFKMSPRYCYGRLDGVGYERLDARKARRLLAILKAPKTYKPYTRYKIGATKYETVDLCDYTFTYNRIIRFSSSQGDVAKLLLSENEHMFSLFFEERTKRTFILWNSCLSTDAYREVSKLIGMKIDMDAPHVIPDHY